MGHEPGFPCIHEPDSHDGACTSLVVGPLPVDLDRTRYFEATTDVGGLYPSCLAYWRTNTTAREGMQVEFRHLGGEWKTSLVPSEDALLRSLRRHEDRLPWREITAGEVPGVGSGGDGEPHA